MCFSIIIILLIDISFKKSRKKKKTSIKSTFMAINYPKILLRTFKKRFQIPNIMEKKKKIKIISYFESSYPLSIRESSKLIFANNPRSLVSVCEIHPEATTVILSTRIYTMNRRDEWTSFKERYKYFTEKPYITTNLCYTSITNRRWPSKNGRVPGPCNSIWARERDETVVGRRQGYVYDAN